MENRSQNAQRVGCFRVIEISMSPRDRSRISSMTKQPEQVCERSNARTRQGKIGIAFIHIYSSTISPLEPRRRGACRRSPDQLGHASLATTGIYLKASPIHGERRYMRSRLPNFFQERNPENSSKLHIHTYENFKYLLLLSIFHTISRR
jgi:hypothetical protein